ncbi:Sugar carrier protein C [Linum grandiflorum]
MTAARVVSDGPGEYYFYEKITSACRPICIFGSVMIGYDIGISGELMSSTIPFLKPLDDFSLAAFTSSLYVAALLSYSLLSRRAARSRKTIVLGLIIVAAGGFVANGILMAYMFHSMKDSIGWLWRVKLLGFECHPIPFGFTFCSLTGLPNAPEEAENTDVTVKSSARADIKPRTNYYIVTDEELAAVPLLMHKDESAVNSSAWVNFSYLVAALAFPLLMQTLTGVNFVLMFYAPVLFYAIVVGSDGYLLFSVVNNVAIVLVSRHMMSMFLSLYDHRLIEEAQ